MTPEKGAESPIDKYERFKDHFPMLWESEMASYGVTEEEKKRLEHIYAPNYGVPCLQEDLMILLMENAGFSLKEANYARKIVAKKKMDEIPKLREMIFERISHKGLADYLWDTGIKTQLGYSFSKNHSLPYSFVGIQTLVLATKFNPIYWNTACLIVNSASLEKEEDEKERGTKYDKIAKAIGEIRARGIKVSLANINESGYGFQPNVKDNEILFGLKGINKIGDDVVDKIIANRPYQSIKDFMSKCPLNKTQMISLIKGGAFDKIDNEWAQKISAKEPRKAIMGFYISKIYDCKKRLTLQNMRGLIEKNLLPKEFDYEKRVFEFNRYIKTLPKIEEGYILDERSAIFVAEVEESLNFDIKLTNVVNGKEILDIGEWQKTYKGIMENVKTWLKENQEETLELMNSLLFKEMWDKYAKGALSAWEMDSLCFYHSPHELIDLDKNKYGVIDFEDLSSEPDVEKFFKKKDVQIPIYNIHRIVGTVIGKNKSRSSISLLTTRGVVEVKFKRDLYAMFDKQISQKQADGTKKVLEKGWFTKGTKLLVSGYRRDKTFISKVYKSTNSHHLYKITNVTNGGRDIEVTFERES